MAEIELFNHPLFRDSSLKAYWRFEGNANDSVGTNHGTASNVSYNASYGKYTQGAYFNGSSSSISLPVSGLGISGSGARTMGCWFNTAQTTSAYRTLLNFPENSTVNQSFMIDICQPEANLNIGLHFWGNNLDSGVSTTVLGLNTWHMVVASYDGSIARVYVDGLYKNQIPVAINTLASGNFMMGYRVAGGATGYYQGYIDDAFVFSRVLTNTEILSLYDFPILKYLKNKKRNRLDLQPYSLGYSS